MELYFDYGGKEISFLKSRDRKLGAAIDLIGHVNRPVDEDLFSCVIHQIIGQQISTKALATVWARLRSDLGQVTSRTLLGAGRDRIQSCGTTFRKADYILDFASKVEDGMFDCARIEALPDSQAIEALSSLKGIGPWTAEMILLFGMHRQDVLSFGDLAILRGMRMVYRHRAISRDFFERCRKRYSPYGSVASIYLWAVAGGAIKGLTDPAAKARKKA